MGILIRPPCMLQKCSKFKRDQVFRYNESSGRLASVDGVFCVGIDEEAVLNLDYCGSLDSQVSDSVIGSLE